MKAFGPMLAACAALAPSVAEARLFDSDEPIRIEIRGAVNDASKGRRGSHPAVLSLRSPGSETHQVRLSPRGITRLKRDVCQFAPLRIALPQGAPPGSLFEGQRSLKLVTHCRSSESFQQHVLLEYAAYRLFNLVTPMSYRVRLAAIDYVDDKGQPIISRAGFFIEDIRDVAARNATREARVGESVPPSAIDPEQTTNVALFEYMIGNLDWSARAGPPGDTCCHNARLIGPLPNGRLAPVPYDFDFSGLVDAPYATPPDVLPVRSVRKRYYRGYCHHNALVPGAVARFQQLRPQLIGLFAQIPGMDERTQGKASAYLAGFFEDIASPQSVSRELLRTCS